VRYYRQQFWDGLVAHPPDVFVISDEKFLDPASFDKLDRWPQFARYLADHYDLATAHSFSSIAVAYRIYLRKGAFPDQQRESFPGPLAMGRGSEHPRDRTDAAMQSMPSLADQAAADAR
jgi:hypothetical protein